MEYEYLIDVISVEEGWEYGIVLTNKRTIFYKPIPKVDLDLFSSFEEIVLYIFIGIFILFYYGILGKVEELLFGTFVGIGLLFSFLLIFIIACVIVLLKYKKIIKYAKNRKKQRYNQPIIDKDPEFLKEIEKFKVFEIFNEEIEKIKIIVSKNMICIEIITIDNNKIKNYYYSGFKKEDLNELAYNIKTKFLKIFRSNIVDVEVY